MKLSRFRPTPKKQIIDLYKEDPQTAKAHFGDNPFELKNIMKYWVRAKNPDLHVIPTDSIVIKIDKEAIKRSGMMIPDSLHGQIPDYMTISLKGKRSLFKSELMMLEMLANTNWTRPLYIAITVGSENFINLGDNFIQEGLAYRISPFNTTKLGGRIDSEKMYDNLMHKFKFGGIDNPNVYLDETVTRMCYTHRRLFSLMINQLLKEGKKDKALKALNYVEKVIPASTVAHDYQCGSLDLAKAYIALGQKKKGEAILNALAAKSVQYAVWYLSLSNERLQMSAQDCLYHLYLLDEFNKTFRQFDSKSTLTKSYEQKFESLYSIYAGRVGK